MCRIHYNYKYKYKINSAHRYVIHMVVVCQGCDEPANQSFTYHHSSFSMIIHIILDQPENESFTYVLHMFTYVYICFTYVYICFTYVYMFTYVYICLHMFYICFTYVHIITLLTVSFIISSMNLKMRILHILIILIIL